MTVRSLKPVRWMPWALVCACLCLSASGLASPPESADARRFVMQNQEQLDKALRGSKNPKSDPKLAATFDKILDYDHFTHQTAGKYWDKLNPEQRTEFSALLKQLIQASYRNNLQSTSNYHLEYKGEAAPLKCSVGAGPCCVGAKPFWEGSIFVNTVASHQKDKRAEPVSIDYAVGKSAGAWKVRDIIFGGVSLVCNYRRQFARFLRNGKFDQLRDKMKARLEELNAKAH